MAYQVRVEKAFDGILGNFHYLSVPGSENPWLSGDIGTVRIIAGAKFYARTNCCTGNEPYKNTNL